MKKQRRLGKEEWYVTAMRGFVFGQAPIKNRHAFGNTPEKKGWGLGTEQKRSKRIAKDMSELPSQLPCHFESSVFMRFEETDQTILRALFLPGCDTPYGGGAFDFDISLPGSYPAVAPQVSTRPPGRAARKDGTQVSPPVKLTMTSQPFLPDIIQAARLKSSSA